MSRRHKPTKGHGRTATGSARAGKQESECPQADEESIFMPRKRTSQDEHEGEPVQRLPDGPGGARQRWMGAKTAKRRNADNTDSAGSVPAYEKIRDLHSSSRYIDTLGLQETRSPGSRSHCPHVGEKCRVVVRSTPHLLYNCVATITAVDEARRTASVILERGFGLEKQHRSVKWSDIKPL